MRAELVAVATGIEPEDLDGPAVGGPEARDGLDGRGLAGAVGAEDAEDLALLDGERDAVDGARPAYCLVRSVTSMTFMHRACRRPPPGTSAGRLDLAAHPVERRVS